MKHVDRIGKALKILSECWRFAWFFHKIWDKIKSFSNFTENYALFAAKKIKRETSLEVKKKIDANSEFMFLPAFYRSCLGILASAKSQNCGAKAIWHLALSHLTINVHGGILDVLFSKLSLVEKTDYIRSSQSDLTVSQF